MQKESKLELAGQKIPRRLRLGGLSANRGRIVCGRWKQRVREGQHLTLLLLSAAAIATFRCTVGYFRCSTKGKEAKEKKAEGAAAFGAD